MLPALVTPTPDALSLEFLRQVIGPQLHAATPTLIKQSGNPCRIYRMALSLNGGHPVVRSVIVKISEPDWPGDPSGPRRESRFYRDLSPRLPLKHPHIYHLGETAAGQTVVVMEDLAAGYRFPAPAYVWRPDEMRCLLRTYARLHVSGRAVLPGPADRGWMWPMRDLRHDPDSILRQADALAAWGIWPRWPQLPRLLERTLAEMALWSDADRTLLHNDVFPPNVALPSDLRDEAVLIDWEMVSVGLAEMDLGYLYMQPFGSSRNVPRDEALSYYWQERQRLEVRIPPPEERAARQRHADAVWALVEIPVAHRMAAQPWPVGSSPRTYWEAMFAVMAERLRALCDELV